MKSEVAVRYLRVEEKEIALIERHRFNVKASTLLHYFALTCSVVF